MDAVCKFQSGAQQGKQHATKLLVPSNRLLEQGAGNRLAHATGRGVTNNLVPRHNTLCVSLRHLRIPIDT